MEEHDLFGIAQLQVTAALAIADAAPPEVGTEHLAACFLKRPCEGFIPNGLQLWKIWPAVVEDRARFARVQCRKRRTS